MQYNVLNGTDGVMRSSRLKTLSEAQDFQCANCEEKEQQCVRMQALKEDSYIVIIHLMTTQAHS